MTAPRLTVAEFRDALDRLGENLTAWPDELRASALDLISASSEAEKLLTEAQALRAALQPTPIKAPAGLADRIIAKALDKDKKS